MKERAREAKKGLLGTPPILPGFLGTVGAQFTVHTRLMTNRVASPCGPATSRARTQGMVPTHASILLRSGVKRHACAR